MTQTSEFEVLPTPPAPNNHASKPTPTVVIQLADHKAPGGGPRASRRTQWVRLADAEDHEYYEHQVLAQTNYPNEYNTRYFTGTGHSTVLEGLRRIIVEHNGWLDPETGEVLPPVTQECRRTKALDEALKAEEVTYAVALKEARTEIAKTLAEQAHRTAEQKIYATVHKEQDEMPGRCCFWDAISPDEIWLTIRAITAARDANLTFLLEKRISSSAT